MDTASSDPPHFTGFIVPALWNIARARLRME